jgi:hypothetical protein
VDVWLPSLESRVRTRAFVVRSSNRRVCNPSASSRARRTLEQPLALEGGAKTMRRSGQRAWVRGDLGRGKWRSGMRLQVNLCSLWETQPGRGQTRCECPGGKAIAHGLRCFRRSDGNGFHCGEEVKSDSLHNSRQAWRVGAMAWAESIYWWHSSAGR